jgi:hypothetical protein
LEATVALCPEANEILNEVVTGACFDASELPVPSPEEKQPPKTPITAPEQGAPFEG